MDRNTVLTYDDFGQIDIRVGKIVTVETFPEARKPSYKLTIDFGAEIGIKRSSAQITARYLSQDLIGKLVVGVVNFAPKRIASFESEVLVLGVPDADGNVVLLEPGFDVPLGGRIY